MTTKSGLKWGPFLDARHDYYHETDLDSSGLTADVSRDLGTVGFNVSYPLYRRFKSMTAVVEPIAQVAASPKAQQDPFLPNEDSQSFEFDDTTLFSVDKSPGFDIYEAGTRLNLGVRTRLQWQSGMKLEALVGRTLRDKDETQFFNTVTIPSGTYKGTYAYDAYGIGKKASDWVVDGDFDTGHGYYGYARVPPGWRYRPPVAG
ncbi:MAG: LPS assembly protein LptD [Asticcacaulis sp.]